MAMMGCRKNETVVTPEVCKIASVESVAGGIATTKYEYGTDGKVSKIIYSPSGNYTTFTYSSSTIVFSSFDKNNKQTSTSKFTLNAAGYIVSNDAIAATYEYDSQGYMTKSTSFGFISYYTYVDENLKTLKIVNPKGETIYSYAFTYLDKPNIIHWQGEILYKDSFNYLIPGQVLYGKGSKNLTNYYSRTEYFSSGFTIGFINITYSFDAKGNIANIVRKSSLEFDTENQFNYNCQ
jgi:hypothetical protein